MERGDNDPQPSGRPSNPRQYGKGKPFYYKNKNYNGQQKNSNSFTSPATMKFALQAAAKENCWTKLPYEQTDGQTSPTQDSSHERCAPPWLPFFCVNEDSTQDSVRRHPRRSPRRRQIPKKIPKNHYIFL
jgi:hypothetical protein